MGWDFDKFGSVTHDAKPELMLGTMVRRYHYKGIIYEVSCVMPDEDTSEYRSHRQEFVSEAYPALIDYPWTLNDFTTQFCSYFYMPAYLFSGEIVDELQMTVNLSKIHELEKSAKVEFTRMSFSSSKNDEGHTSRSAILKLGVHYAQAWDIQTGNTLEAVREDCSNVIDKLHELNFLNGD